MTIEKKESAEELFSKKPYYPPQIVSYGNIAEITRAVGKTGAADGGGVTSNNKTQL